MSSTGKPRIIAIVGTRVKGSENQKTIDSKVLEIIQKFDSSTIFISGGASSGADKSCKDKCNWLNRKYIEAPAFWHKPGQWAENFNYGAGFIRNSIIAELCDECFAIWDSKSGGTKDTIDKCLNLGKKVTVVPA